MEISTLSLDSQVSVSDADGVVLANSEQIYAVNKKHALASLPG